MLLLAIPAGGAQCCPCGLQAGSEATGLSLAPSLIFFRLYLKESPKATPSIASLLQAIPWLQHFHSDSWVEGRFEQLWLLLPRQL